MRVVDPTTGKSYVENRRVRYNEPGQPRELTFSCYRHYAFLAIRNLKETSPEWLGRVTVPEGKRVRHRFWQPGGGYDRNVTSTAALRAVIEYIHANPVRRGLVASAEDWEWSSARWYAGLRSVKLEMDGDVLAELARG